MEGILGKLAYGILAVDCRGYGIPLVGEYLTEVLPILGVSSSTMSMVWLPINL
jgi:hypothetical protein